MCVFNCKSTKFCGEIYRADDFAWSSLANSSFSRNFLFVSHPVDKVLPPAVVLLSGGMDSATVLAVASAEYSCHALSFSYGQKHASELDAARKIAQQLAVKEHVVFPVNLAVFGGSALTDAEIPVLKMDPAREGIPNTYVPARNLIFLSLALAWMEVLGSRHIFIGANVVDYSGYPDCRPEFFRAFETTCNLATRAGQSGHKIRVHSPLVEMRKADIILLGTELGLDYSQTVSCYSARPGGLACGVCESCYFRRKGFMEAKIPDPTRYQQ